MNKASKERVRGVELLAAQTRMYLNTLEPEDIERLPQHERGLVGYINVGLNLFDDAQTHAKRRTSKELAVAYMLEMFEGAAKHLRETKSGAPKKVVIRSDPDWSLDRRDPTLDPPPSSHARAREDEIAWPTDRDREMCRLVCRDYDHGKKFGAEPAEEMGAVRLAQYRVELLRKDGAAMETYHAEAWSEGKQAGTQLLDQIRSIVHEDGPDDERIEVLRALFRTERD